MDDDLVHAIRNKKKSSMRLAVNCVKDSKAQACVSAGNTGALMSISKIILKTIKGLIDLQYVHLYQQRKTLCRCLI